MNSHKPGDMISPAPDGPATQAGSGINQLLHNLAREYPTTWPWQAIACILYYHELALRGDHSHDYEYGLLLSWLTETVEAGVAFKQQSLAEH